jgi:Tol biopolymer transport system component
MRRALVWVIAGCGFSPNHQTQASGSDAAIDGTPGAPPDAEMLDALDLSRDCMPLWQNGTIAFYPPVALTELDTPAVERDPFVSQDELTIYFSQEHALAGGGVDADIFTATREHVGDPFGSATPFGVVDTTSYESKMSISIDGLTLVVCRSASPAGDDEYLATRTSTSDPWPTPQLNDMDDVNLNYAPYDPELGSDGKTLYFAPIADEGDPQQLAVATRSSTTAEFEVQAVPGYTAGSNTNDADPWADPTGRLFLFSRSIVGVGDTDIVYALGSNFANVMPVPDVNTVGTSDGDAWLSPNGCRLYFSSNRAGSYDLYVANAK